MSAVVKELTGSPYLGIPAAKFLHFSESFIDLLLGIQLHAMFEICINSLSRVTTFNIFRGRKMMMMMKVRRKKMVPDQKIPARRYLQQFYIF